jgi:F420-0:gamma-glutamyl ligase
MADMDFWKECIAEGACECGLAITENQICCLAETVKSAHENYGMAFYSPPPSDRIKAIEREQEQKYNKLKLEFEEYRSNAELAVKKALHQYSDAVVSIGNGGEVRLINGRSDVIQM